MFIRAEQEETDRLGAMKVKSAIRRICKDCRLVRRKGRLYNVCKRNPRHKQRQGIHTNACTSSGNNTVAATTAAVATAPSSASAAASVPYTSKMGANVSRTAALYPTFGMRVCKSTAALGVNGVPTAFFSTITSAATKSSQGNLQRMMKSQARALNCAVVAKKVKNTPHAVQVARASMGLFCSTLL